MEKTTQRGAVLHHLIKFGSLTSFEAFELFGATRLSAIIFDLRKQGYNIWTDSVSTKNRYGQPTTYAKYVLISTPEDKTDE